MEEYIPKVRKDKNSVSNMDEWGVTEKAEKKVCSVQDIFENKKCMRLQQVYRTT